MGSYQEDKIVTEEVLPFSVEHQKLSSLIYHNLFEYPLKNSELKKWMVGQAGFLDIQKSIVVGSMDEFYFLNAKHELVAKRLLKEKLSKNKLKLAQKAARVIALNPFIKMVAVTGSLAMKNAKDGDDIDLMIVTKAGTLWISRILVYGLLNLFGYKIRKPNVKDEKEKLCLNIWIDEAALAWPKNKRNIYTAHEVAQTMPIINKDKTYQRFLQKNYWASNFWPNAASWDKSAKENLKEVRELKLLSSVEDLAYRFQYNYMRSKITNEKVNKKRALFHPNDYSNKILTILKNF